jgi:hypothetical protein
MVNQQQKEFKKKLQTRRLDQSRKNTFRCQFPNLSRANNAITTTPQKTLIPPNQNIRNNKTDQQDKEATHNCQIWW